MSAPRPLTQKEIALFFFPLLLNVQLMSVSHSIINAALARLPDFITALAAFSVAMILHIFVASPSYQNHTITIAMARGRRSLKGVVLFILLVAVYVSALLALLAFTPVGDLVLGGFLGISGEIAEGARSVLGMLVFLPFFTGFRGFFQGICIRARRTGLVSFATVVRIAALFLFLAVGHPWFSGPTLGGFALLACIVVETALMGVFAWRCGFPEGEGNDEKRVRDILRFAFPLAWSSCLQQTVPLLINAILGRLPDAALALAAFGVIRGFLFLLAGPMRNLQQAYLTLVQQAPDYRQMVIFYRRVGGALALLTILVAYPLNASVLGGLMGLEEEVRRYIAFPLACCALYPFLSGATYLLRGFFTGAHQTTVLGRSTIYKVLFILLCWIPFLLTTVPVPGVAVAVFLLMSSELFEALYLRTRRQGLLAEGLELHPLGR